ncbi:MAG: hypothetical protein ACTSXD_05040 [Candidatus Heimdallarchaeaceae archaeon]
MEEKVKIGEKEFTVKEFMYVDIINLESMDRKEQAKEMIKLATGISDEELNKLTLSEGLQLQKKINEINKLESKNFRLPTE